jgi:hypothetical protein
MRAIGVLVLALAAAVALPLWGQEPADAVVARLQAEGYTVRTVEQTLLGRIRIEAVKDGQRREVVVDRATGEILRDYVDETPEGG